MIQPLEFKREYIHNNSFHTDQNTSLETMIAAKHFISGYFILLFVISLKSSCFSLEIII